MTTLAPANLIAVEAYYVAHHGVNLGIVGDASHVGGGTSYHLGKDQLRPGAYSAVTDRDRAGLSNYASAVDLGRIRDSLLPLRKFSAWFVDQCRHNSVDTRDVREVIYSPDGTTVLRWDRERGVGSAPRDGEADFSHRTHTHISYYRDSRGRSQVGPFRRYFDPAPAPTHTVHIAHGAVVRVYSVSATGCILGNGDGTYGKDTRWWRAASQGACGAPVRRETCDGRSQATTVRKIGGAFAGKHIRIDPPGVTVS